MQIELLTVELQEAREQNELLEFRVHELEQNKVSPKLFINKNLRLSFVLLCKFNLRFYFSFYRNLRALTQVKQWKK